MVKQLDNLKKDTSKAIKWVAAEFKYAKELEDDLTKIKKEEPKAASRDVSRALRTLRWVGRGERRVDRFTKRIIDELKELEAIVPTKQQEEAKKLKEELRIAEAKLVRSTSIFRGDLRKEFLEIKTDEDLSRKLKGKDLEKVQINLTRLFQRVQGSLSELNRWIASTQVILKNIKKFEEKLEDMAA